MAPGPLRAPPSPGAPRGPLWLELLPSSSPPQCVGGGVTNSCFLVREWGYSDASEHRNTRAVLRTASVHRRTNMPGPRRVFLVRVRAVVLLRSPRLLAANTACCCRQCADNSLPPSEVPASGGRGPDLVRALAPARSQRTGCLRKGVPSRRRETRRGEVVGVARFCGSW